MGEKSLYNEQKASLPDEQRTWTDPGRVAYDFRSDYVTTPTFPMMQAIQETTLGDDVMMEDTATNEFQSFIASLTGKEESLFVMSGTMGNQVALRAALGTPPYSILADQRSHMTYMELGGAATLWGALVVCVSPSNDHHLTVEDVRARATLQSGIYHCPTRVICLENTLNGTIMPLKDVQAIGKWAHEQEPPIHVYMDGARLWEAVAAGAGSLHEFCSAVDSVSLCLTKGLGAPVGSVLAGSSAFIERARMVRKLLGGGIRAAGVLTAPARAAVEQVYLGGRLRAAQVNAARIAKAWTEMGGGLLQPTETNMVWLHLPGGDADKARLLKLASESGLKFMPGLPMGRIVVHYQICEDAVQQLCQVMKQFLDQS